MSALPIVILLAQAGSAGGEQVDPFQRAAWTAAIIGVVVSTPMALIQFVFNWRKQQRDTRIEQAKFGYGLIDSVFGDEWASDLLYSLDGSYEKAGRTKGSSSRAQDFVAVFRDGQSLPTDRAVELHSRVDALLFFLDRFEHAIQAGLTTFETVHTPTAYYVNVLRDYKPRLADYIARVGYVRVLAFLRRFPGEWGD